jgi:acetylornithine deacetylase
VIDFLLDILNFDSTSGRENELAKYIYTNYKPFSSTAEIQETKEGRLNVFFKTGEPRIIFCSHLDTVPPFIKPEKKDDIINGRGSCDAKGQIAYLLEVYEQLITEGYDNIGMLMLSGEEDGSQGAIRANENLINCEFIIIGEPTENKFIKASKGNLLVNVTFKGKSCHSGYPEKGDSAFDRALKFFIKLNSINFPNDSLLGKTTYNVGKFISDNAHNVVSDYITCKIFFRTTFESNGLIESTLKSISDERTEYEFICGDAPMKFYTEDNVETNVVSFGTDAPSFTNVPNKILYGPGSILDAHTGHEFVRIKDLYKAVEDIKLLFKKITNEN